MERKRFNKRRHNWNDQKNTANNNKKNQHYQEKSQNTAPKFHFVPHENKDEQLKKEQAILEFKAREVSCPVCGELITDMSSAMTDKASGNPAHFDCVFKKVADSEPTGQNEKVAYIGQGRFAVLSYENIRDQKNFKIKKIIEWESRDEKPDWRGEMSHLFSQVE